MRAILTRVCGVLAALVVCAWFVVGIRQAHAINAATAIVSASPRLSAGEAARANALLAEARFLNPDAEVDILRARVVSERGHNRAADRILKRVVAREPMNLEAWAWLGRTAANDAVLGLSYLHTSELLPPIAKRG